MFCARATSSTKASGHTRLANSCFVTSRPAFSTRRRRVSKAFGVSGMASPLHNKRRSVESRRQTPNSYIPVSEVIGKLLALETHRRMQVGEFYQENPKFLLILCEFSPL